jgi:hypothetical protein
VEKESRINGEKERKQMVEVEECTFKPKVKMSKTAFNFQQTRDIDMFSPDFTAMPPHLT